MPYSRKLQQVAENQLHLPRPLHDYQWDGITFLYRSQSALLADEMGLGKTVQAIIALALLLNEQGNGISRALIVAPVSLLANWMQELEMWAPSLAVRRVQGDAFSRETFYLLPIPILVSSYEYVRADGLDRIPSGTFDIVILDEAQRIKNQNSATALACQLLPRKRSWALSATPLENKESDVLSILNFLDPLCFQDSSGPRLIQKLESLMVRRRKADVRSELPPVIIQDLKIDLSEAQREKYDELWESRGEIVRNLTNSTEINTALLGLITRLKIICNFDPDKNVSSKLDALIEVCESAGESARILIFSQFVKTLQWLSARLSIPYDILTGSMSTDERGRVIDQFKNEMSPRVLLVSIKAGGVGLNLGQATHVILFDRWWNPAVEVQAIYRAHRFTREEPLHVFRFLALDTIEERIAAILHQKEALFDEVVESVQSNSAHFTKEELLRILELAHTSARPITAQED